MNQKFIFILILLKLTIALYTQNNILSEIEQFTNKINVLNYRVFYNNSSNKDESFRIYFNVSYDTDITDISDFKNQMKNLSPETIVIIDKTFIIHPLSPEDYYSFDNESYDVIWTLPEIDNDIKLKPSLTNNQIALSILNYEKINNDKLELLRNKIEEVFNTTIIKKYTKFSKSEHIYQTENILNKYNDLIINYGYSHWDITSRFYPNKEYNQVHLVFKLNAKIENYNQIIEEFESKLNNKTDIKLVKEITLYDIEQKPFEETGPTSLYGIESIRSKDNIISLIFDAKLSKSDILSIKDEWVDEYSIKR